MTALRVMSFNIRTAAIDDGPNRWELRRELALERIAALQPDLLGLQECQARLQKPDLLAALPGYAFLGAERGGQGDASHEISAIMVREAACEILAERTFWLSPTPDTPASLAWKSAFPRTVTLARLRRRADQRELVFLNTHLDYVPSAALGGAGVLRCAIDELPPDLPLVLSGDFNAGKRSRVYHTLLGSEPRRLQDAHRVAGNGSGPKAEGSFHAFGRLRLPQAIDWILVSSHWTVQAAGLDRSARPPLYPSDHLPIWAVLE